MRQKVKTAAGATASDAIKQKEERTKEIETIEKMSNHLERDEIGQQVLIDAAHLHDVRKAQEAKELANKVDKEMASFEAEREQLEQEAARKAIAQQAAAKKRAAAIAAEREQKSPRLIAVSKKADNMPAAETGQKTEATP